MFGKYELLERINTGGMAETIKARDTGAPGRPIVAVKRILPHLIEDVQYLTMFRDETRLLARLDHDNVIRTLEVGEVDGTPYAALEYVHGQDARMLLHHARQGETKIPLPIACYLVAQAARGLDYAHDLADEDGTALGLVHRDVSLQNILMSYDGAVKLIDFGIAMAAGNVDRTETGIIKGKFGYMSPEQVRNESLDRRSDLFALGICLWELLVGERLFPGKNSSETLRRVREADIESPRERNPEIPEALGAITMRALSRYPDDRYQTADDFRRALLEFMAESQNECGPPEIAKYVREVFAEELRKQPSPDVLVSEVARRFDEDSGLAAFDGLDPVSTVSALHDQATDLESGAAVLSDVPPRREDTPVRREDTPARGEDTPARTPVGKPAHTTPSHPSVPPMVPRRSSIPDGHLSWEDVVRGRATAPRVSEPLPRSGASAPRLRRVTPMPMRADPVSGARPLPKPLPTPELEATPVHAPVPARPPEPSAPRRAPPVAVLLALGVTSMALVAAGVMLFARPAPGTLQLATDPVEAIVTVDGARLAAERSPFLITDLEPKVEHEIRVAKAGHRDWSSKLVLQPGQTLTLPVVTLERMGGGGEATTAVPEGEGAERSAGAPGGQGGPSDVAAPAEPSGMAVGARPPVTTRVGGVVASKGSSEGANAEKSATRVPRSGDGAKGTGTLRINARPWAEVHVDGKYVGNTPQTGLSLAAGAHVVRLANPQFGLSKTIRVEVAAGETVTRVVQLE